jgi:hypothetical protein
MTSYQQNKCDEFFGFIKVGDYIYPGHLKSKLGIDIRAAYDILENLKKQGFLKNLYEIYCFDCDKSKCKYLESLGQFTPDLYCDFCGKHLSIEENIVVLYKVINV